MEIKVLIVDDQRLMREGLKTILDLENDITVVDIAENGRDALDKILINKPDVVLMDIRMPVMNGVECTGHIKHEYPDIKVLILTTFDDDEYIIDGLKNGAVGYLLKDLPSEKLISSIRDIYNGSSIMQSEIAAKLISHITNPKNEANGSSQPSSFSKKDVDELTEREKEILSLIAKGLSNKEISRTLYISEGTVKNYISSIYDKTGITNRSKIMLYALENK